MRAIIVAPHGFLPISNMGDIFIYYYYYAVDSTHTRFAGRHLAQRLLPFNVHMIRVIIMSNNIMVDEAKLLQLSHTHTHTEWNHHKDSKWCARTHVCHASQRFYSSMPTHSQHIYKAQPGNIMGITYSLSHTTFIYIIIIIQRPCRIVSCVRRVHNYEARVAQG